jgi:hypothetical protein
MPEWSRAYVESVLAARARFRVLAREPGLLQPPEAAPAVLACACAKAPPIEPRETAFESCQEPLPSQERPAATRASASPVPEAPIAGPLDPPPGREPAAAPHHPPPEESAIADEPELGARILPSLADSLD